MANGALAGKRILVTRSREQASVLSAELARLGADAIEIPTIEILPPISFGSLDAAFKSLWRYQWLVVTSANAVRVIRERSAVLRIAPADFSHLKIAAVGGATAHALREAGFSVSVVPKEYVAESLLKTLGDQVRGANVLIVRAAIARDVLPEVLKQRGARVDVVEAYRTVVPQSSVAKIAELFAENPPDAATFTSSSTVTNFLILLQAAGCERPAGMRAISIGPITSRTLRDHGWEPSAEANPHTVEGLVESMIRTIGPG